MLKKPKHPKGYWENKAKTLLKIELTRHNLTYAELAKRLQAIGVPETEPNIRNKLSRGTFSAIFLIQTLEALGVDHLSLR
jgi:hypothetical protein